MGGGRGYIEWEKQHTTSHSHTQGGSPDGMCHDNMLKVSVLFGNISDDGICFWRILTTRFISLPSTPWWDGLYRIQRQHVWGILGHFPSTFTKRGFSWDTNICVLQACIPLGMNTIFDEKTRKLDRSDVMYAVIFFLVVLRTKCLTAFCSWSVLGTDYLFFTEL